MAQLPAAPASMVKFIMTIRPENRLAAAKVAEMAFFSTLKKLAQFGDYSPAENNRLAEEAAIAEVAYRYRRR
jgi:hypothetical protein